MIHFTSKMVFVNHQKESFFFRETTDFISNISFDKFLAYEKLKSILKKKSFVIIQI